MNGGLERRLRRELTAPGATVRFPHYGQVQPLTKSDRGRECGDLMFGRICLTVRVGDEDRAAHLHRGSLADGAAS